MPSLGSFQADGFHDHYCLTLDVDFTEEEKELGETFLVFVQDFLTKHPVCKTDKIDADLLTVPNVYRICIGFEFFTMKDVMCFMNAVYKYIGEPEQSKITEDDSSLEKNSEQISLIGGGTVEELSNGVQGTIGKTKKEKSTEKISSEGE